jgi:LDH2 family malate/lactate/ureidoglycolate dehydrogenase
MFSYQQLFRFTQSIFQSMGHAEADAQLATEVLLAADLRGVDSHGVARLSGYVRLWEAGRHKRPSQRAGSVRNVPVPL